MVPVMEHLGTGLRDIASEWLNPDSDLPVSRARALDSFPHSGLQEEHKLAWGRGKGIPGEETTFGKAQKHQRATVPFGAEKANLVKVVLQDSEATAAVWQSR